MLPLNELPLSILLKIFSNLPAAEVIRLKLVCKLWQELTGCVRFKSLSLCQPELGDAKVNNFYLRYHLRYQKDFDLYLNDFEKFLKSTELMLSRVQHLVVCLHESHLDLANIRFMESFLNGIKSLEELEFTVFECYGFLEPFSKVVLDLEHLRKLYVRCEQQTFQLNCPELCHLNVLDLKNYHIRYPEKLRTLMATAPLADIKKFVNLKILIVFLRLQDITSIPQKFFKRLPKKLKLLIFFPAEFVFGDHRRFSNERNLEDYFLGHYPIDQEGSSLRVFYLGIEISLGQLTGPERDHLPKRSSIESYTEFLLTNLAKSVDANACIQILKYETIESRLTTFDLLYEKIYSDHPYCNVSLNQRVADQARLFEFIRKAKPATLDINKAAIFPRIFYEHLAEVCSPFLKNIHFDAFDLDSEPDPFDFLFKMTELEEIVVIGSGLAITKCLDFVITAYERLESLDAFAFSGWFGIQLAHFLRVSYYTGQDGLDSVIDKSISFGGDERKGLTVLKYLAAKWKEKQEQNESDDLLELLLLVGELEQQGNIDRFASGVILDHVKATPIYLASSHNSN